MIFLQKPAENRLEFVFCPETRMGAGLAQWFSLGENVLCRGKKGGDRPLVMGLNGRTRGALGCAGPYPRPLGLTTWGPGLSRSLRRWAGGRSGICSSCAADFVMPAKAGAHPYWVACRDASPPSGLEEASQ